MKFTDANGKKYTLPKGEDVYWRISVYALILKGNRLLTVIPTWNKLFELPGGAVEKNENIMDGLKRECYEETGYRIKIIDNTPFYLGEENFYNRVLKKFYKSIIIVFSANLTSNEQDRSIINTADGDEISSINWIPINKLTKSNTHRIIYPAIKIIQRKCVKISLF